MLTGNYRKNTTLITSAITSGLLWIVLLHYDNERIQQLKNNDNNTQITTSTLVAAAAMHLPVEQQQLKITNKGRKIKQNVYSQKNADKNLPACKLEPGNHTRRT